MNISPSNNAQSESEYLFTPKLVYTTTEFKRNLITFFDEMRNLCPIFNCYRDCNEELVK